jgi:hypothetical protein
MRIPLHLLAVMGSTGDASAPVLQDAGARHGQCFNTLRLFARILKGPSTKYIC